MSGNSAKEVMVDVGVASIVGVSVCCRTLHDFARTHEHKVIKVRSQNDNIMLWTSLSWSVSVQSRSSDYDPTFEDLACSAEYGRLCYAEDRNYDL